MQNEKALGEEDPRRDEGSSRARDDPARDDPGWTMFSSWTYERMGESEGWVSDNRRI